MPDVVVRCTGCGQDYLGASLPGRRDRCESCGEDLRSCRNCNFFDPGAYNDCREPSAERVTDKTAANFCDYFRPGSSAKTDSASGDGGDGSARDELEALFRK